MSRPIPQPQLQLLVDAADLAANNATLAGILEALDEPCTIEQLTAALHVSMTRNAKALLARMADCEPDDQVAHVRAHETAIWVRGMIFGCAIGPRPLPNEVLDAGQPDQGR